MRLQLDNGKSYELNAMFKPAKVGQAEAWGTFRNNLAAWPKGLIIPFEATKRTLRGLVNWLIVFTLHSFSLLMLPLLSLFGYSMKAYTLFTREDQEKMEQYREDLRLVYKKLADISDQEEYQRKLSEEIAKIKPY
ncbi:MAG: hypothetical protein H7A01_09070 [Hahellaceae bacterium]|jgi:hypothetical protein|nr:hypothetical protein [Hahellaceae bacterium]MCP5211377.1 hypothetical protein [Hahellaceae bacterium]